MKQTLAQNAEDRIYGASAPKAAFAVWQWEDLIEKQVYSTLSTDYLTTDSYQLDSNPKTDQAALPHRSNRLAALTRRFDSIIYQDNPSHQIITKDRILAAKKRRISLEETRIPGKEKEDYSGQAAQERQPEEQIDQAAPLR